MNFLEYEKAAARTVNPELGAKDRLMDAAAGLSEEAGEVLALIRKAVYQGKPLVIADVEAELGDALWCLAMTARASGLSLQSVAEANIEKLRARHPSR